MNAYRLAQKRFWIMVLAMVSCLSYAALLIDLDSTLVVIFGREDKYVITQSDLRKLNLEGTPRTLEQLIYEKLMFDEAAAHHWVPEHERIVKQLEELAAHNHMSMDQFKQLLASVGYTWEEAIEQYTIIVAINQLISIRISSRLIVPEREVRAYWEANPEMEEASYYLERALVPYSMKMKRAEQKKQLEDYARTGKGVKGVLWSDPFWISTSDIAADKEFIIKLQENETSLPHETENGFELFRLKRKKPEHLRTLEERYREIADKLRKPKYEELMKEYRKELLANAFILYLDPTLELKK